jgi:hypothetical protein
MPDESPDSARGSAELLKIMMLVGAVIGIISVFQPWFSTSFGSIRFDYSGLDFLLKSLNYPEGYPGVGLFAYMPPIVLIASAAALVASVLTFTKHERKGAIAGTVLGAAILIPTLIYVFYPVSKIAITSPAADLIADIKLMDYLGAGVHFAAIAGIFLIIGGAVLLLYRKKGSGARENEPL